jgi:ATP phosphoribosyltransferase
MLRLAIQKSGRLSHKSLELIQECGVKVQYSDKTLKAVASNFPLEIIFLRDDDIPEYVAEGTVDIGIVGRNEIREKQKPTYETLELGFSKCRLSIAAPEASSIQSLSDLEGLNIATTYPNVLQNFLEDNQIQAYIREISGSVEVAPSIGLADCICDLVSSGNTLAQNNLREVKTILNSQAVLIQSQENLESHKQDLLEKLVFRVQSVLKAQNLKYIALNIPTEKIDQVTTMIPGLKNPTIAELNTPGWSSLQSVVPEDNFWEVVNNLKAVGAQGILVMPIEKVVS